MKVYTVIASRRYGRHGAEQKWFGSKTDAMHYARDLTANSQVGRNTRCNYASRGLRFYIVKVESVVELPPVAVSVRNLTKRDVRLEFYRRGT